MESSEGLHTVATLANLPRIGRVRLKTVLAQIARDGGQAPALGDVIERFRAQFFSGITTEQIETAQRQADDMLERCRTLGVQMHPFGCVSYPSQLTRLREPPALLFSLGQFEFNRTLRVAVIGTRKPTDWGLETVVACVDEITQHQGIVVSGLALGIDAAAHAACVQGAGTTWAVLAHGLHTVSPASNRELAKRVRDSGGALISEYPPGEAAQRHYFVERDRIQAGLADAVLVIESGIDGGAMHTVRFAREAGVPVWVTFPQAKVAQAEAGVADLPGPQQGTWQLLATKTASRVATPKGLARMLSELQSAPPPPTALFAP
jgi:DNA processing protein